jgi:hypothetical protein
VQNCKISIGKNISYFMFKVFKNKQQQQKQQHKDKTEQPTQKNYILNKCLHEIEVKQLHVLTGYSFPLHMFD